MNKTFARIMASDCIAKRYIVIVMMAFGICIVHVMRVNVAMTVVAILEERLPDEHKWGVTVAPMGFSAPAAKWDPFQIGVLHAIFYIGYILTQIPGGYLSTIVPATRIFGGCILISCSLNLLVPVAIDRFTYWFTCLVRFMQGMSEGFLFPSCYEIMRYWTVPSERSTTGSVISTGIYLGPVFGLVTSGYIAHYIGWPYMFYIDGGVGVAWFVCWLFLIHQTPSIHPYITDEELKFIQKEQDESVIRYEHDRIPWKDIFLSMPVWALNVCNFARNFIFLLLLTYEPAYLNCFRFTIKENGLYSAIPHFLMTIVAATSGPLADLLNRDPMMTRTNIRKLFTCVGFGAEGICIFLLFFVYEGTTALTFLTIGVGMSGLTVSGWQINHLDLAPRYASVLIAISMTFGTMAGIASPIMAGHMTKDQRIYEWSNVWLVTAFILGFAVLFYALFGSGEKQPWAEPKPQEVRLVNNKSPFESTCYKTVRTQTEISYFDSAAEGDDVQSKVKNVYKERKQTHTQEGVYEDVSPSSDSGWSKEEKVSSNPFETSDEENNEEEDNDDSNPFSAKTK